MKDLGRQGYGPTIAFLAEENKTDYRGRRLYDAWTKTDKCRPTVMAMIEKAVQ